MKKVLMSMRVTEASNYNEKRNSIAFDYIEYFEKLGYLVQLIPNNSKNINNYFDKEVKVVVLTGGNNVNPKLYKSEDKLTDVYIQRDITEKKLLKKAIKKDISVLGICRGFHFINIYYSGKITHNIKNHVNKNHKLISKKELLNSKKTNSFHNQGVSSDDLAKDLQVLAKSEDGFIEAFRYKKNKVLALQWHPERQNKKYDKKLIKRFLKGRI
ncbi:C26 family cysteine hydrolase domain-containing family [bacterium]|nr:C26 family cysteine hydrolase domain-containing family [bacterium]